jgi:hypothetical protein
MAPMGEVFRLGAVVGAYRWEGGPGGGGAWCVWCMVLAWLCRGLLGLYCATVLPVAVALPRSEANTTHPDSSETTLRHPDPDTARARQGTHADCPGCVVICLHAQR